MPQTQIFVQADDVVQALYTRCMALSDAGYLDAAGFYMRKILEVIASSFIDRYDELGLDAQFDEFLAQNGVVRYRATLDDKVDYLLARGNLPAESRATYDDVRRYGNAAVHKTYFEEDPAYHAELLERLSRELAAFHTMALQS